MNTNEHGFLSPRENARNLLPLRLERGEGWGGYGDNTSLTDECQDIANNRLCEQAARTAKGDLLPISSQPPRSNEYGGCDEIGNKSWRMSARPRISASVEKVSTMCCHQSVSDVLSPCREVSKSAPSQSPSGRGHQRTPTDCERWLPLPRATATCRRRRG